MSFGRLKDSSVFSPSNTKNWIKKVYLQRKWLLKGRIRWRVWLWWWLSLRLSKDQSLPSKTVSLRIDLTRTIRQDVPALRERWLHHNHNLTKIVLSLKSKFKELKDNLTNTRSAIKAKEKENLLTKKVSTTSTLLINFGCSDHKATGPTVIELLYPLLVNHVC